MQSARYAQIVTENAHKSLANVIQEKQNLPIESAGVHAPP